MSGDILKAYSSSRSCFFPIMLEKPSQNIIWCCIYIDDIVYASKTFKFADDTNTF